jgi:hypothetical protein
MQEKDDIRRELEELAPGFPAKPGIVPPAGYFDQNPERLLNQWSTVQKQHRITVLRRLVAIAAVITGLVIGLLCWQQPADSDSPLQQISSADAYAYVQDNIAEFHIMIESASLEMATGEAIDLPPADAEHYILEELDDSELEQLF